ncbi:hypothetical protein GC194_12975 [bacterium]|nr:hypothetical protein [bacterium]
MAIKQLLLFRHSHAQSSHPDGDFRRMLTARGRQVAREVAAHIAAEYTPQLCYISTAQRTRETFEIANEYWQLPEDALEFQRKLYTGNATDYTDVLESTNDAIHRVCIIGHNPSISYLAMHLCPAFQEGLSPASALLLQCELAHWSTLPPVWKLEKYINASEWNT